MNEETTVLQENEFTKGRIIKSTGGLYSVEAFDNDGRIYECRAKGAFRREKVTPLTGDIVKFRNVDETTGFIVEICERKNSLIRPAAANIDMLVLVCAAAHPDPDLFIIDKLTAIAEFNGIDVYLVINKCDIKNAGELENIYSSAGFKVAALSASHPEKYASELECIREALRGKISFFSGASGVGKSSLLNALYPSFSQETGEISRKISRGKHTTRVTELFKIDRDTYIGDTPGFSMVDVVGFNLLTLDGLLDSFPDIKKHAGSCRYTDCTHTCEDGCGVVEAVSDGTIQTSRHESYTRLYRELKEANNKWK